MAMLIKTDGTCHEVIGEKKRGLLSYKQIRDAIGGGYIELVSCDPEVTGGYNHYYCDEEGKLKGLPPNLAATKLSTYTAPDDIVVGDVLFCKTVGGESI